MFLVTDEEKYTVADRKKYSNSFYKGMFSSAMFSLAWFLGLIIFRAVQKY